MSLFDGSDNELTYPEALIEIAQRVSWATEAHQVQVVHALRKHFDMLPEAPEKPYYADARDQTISNYEAELERLRKAEKQREADAAELEQLRKEKADSEAKASGKKAEK